MGDLLKRLEAREFIYQVSDPILGELLERESMSVYAGFDPSADSLHLGHFRPIIGLMRFQRDGHRPIAVVGGATGMIGDPSGRDQERQLLNLETLRANETGIRNQLARFLDFDCGANSAVLVNNYDWLGSFNYLDFLLNNRRAFLGQQHDRQGIRQAALDQPGSGDQLHRVFVSNTPSL